MIKQLGRILLDLVPGTIFRHNIFRNGKDPFAPKCISPACLATIDGFPRSANTWIYYNIQLSFPKVMFAHHIHSWQQFLFSKLFRRYSVLIVRHPDLCVQSLVTKKGGGYFLTFLEYAICVGLGGVFAKKIAVFDELISKEGMNDFLDFLIPILGHDRLLVPEIEIDKLMQIRTIHKNVSTTPISHADLNFFDLGMRKISILIFQKVCERA